MQALQGQNHYLCLTVFHAVLAGEYWHKTSDINACAFAKQTKLAIISCRPIKFSLSLLLLFCLFQKQIFFICNFKLSALLDMSLQRHQNDCVVSVVPAFNQQQKQKNNIGVRNFQESDFMQQTRKVSFRLCWGSMTCFQLLKKN